MSKFVEVTRKEKLKAFRLEAALFVNGPVEIPEHRLCLSLNTDGKNVCLRFTFACIGGVEYPLQGWLLINDDGNHQYVLNDDQFDRLFQRA